MQDLGNYLKKHREKQGLSLEDLASRTKIHIQKLRDIESGNKEALPAKVYCIGLVKSYARELKLDLNEVDQLCHQAFDETHEAPVAKEKKPVEKSTITPEQSQAADDESQPVGRFRVPKTMIVIGSLCLAALLVFGIVEVVEKMNAYSKEEELPKEIYSSAVNDGSENHSETEGKDAVELELEKQEEPKPAPVVKEAPEPENNKVVAAAEPQEEDVTEENFNSPNPIQETNVKKVVSDNKLTVTALEPVRAEVIWADGYVQVMLLKSQESKTLVFSQPITLRVNNGGAVQVSYNDGEKKVPGEFNQPLEIKYP